MKIDKGTIAVYSNSRLVIPGQLYGRLQAAMHRLFEVPHTRGKRLELHKRLYGRWLDIMAARSRYWEYDVAGDGTSWRPLGKGK